MSVQIEPLDRYRVEPIGILARIHALPVSRATRRVLMEMIARLPTDERLLVETTLIERRGDIDNALIEALAYKEVSAQGEIETLWRELVDAVFHERIMNGGLNKAFVQSIKPESYLEHRKHKDEQKTRMLQVGLRTGNKPEPEVWQMLVSIIDRGHRAISHSTLRNRGSGAEINNRQQTFITSLKYLVKDTGILYRDILGALEEEGVHLSSSQEVEEFLRSEGIQREGLIEYLRDLGNRVEQDTIPTSISAVVYLRQYQVLAGIKAHYGTHIKFVHLIHAFAEGLRVFFDAMGAYRIIQDDIASQLAHDSFATCVSISSQFNVTDTTLMIPEVFALRQLYRGVSDFLTMRDAAQVIVDFPFEMVETINEEITHSLCEKVDVKRSVYDAEIVVNKVCNSIIDHMLVNSTEEGVLVAGYFITLREAIVEVVRNHFSIGTQEESNIFNTEANTFGRYITFIQEKCAQASGSITSAFEHGEAASADALSMETLTDTLDVLDYVDLSDKTGRDELLNQIRYTNSVISKYSSVPELVKNSLLTLEYALCAKPLVLVRSEVGDRWSSQKPFVAFPWDERLAVYQMNINLFNILVRSLATKELLIEGDKLHKDAIEQLRIMVEGLDGLHRYILPEIEEDMRRDMEIKELLEKDGQFSFRLEDLTSDIFMLYKDTNIEKLRKALKNNDLSTSQVIKIIESAVELLQRNEGVGHTFLSSLS